MQMAATEVQDSARQARAALADAKADAGDWQARHAAAAQQLAARERECAEQDAQNKVTCSAHILSEKRPSWTRGTLARMPLQDDAGCILPCRQPGPLGRYPNLGSSSLPVGLLDGASSC